MRRTSWPLRPSRRELLQLGLACAVHAALPDEATSQPSATRGPGRSWRPEYRRTLESVLILVPSGDVSDQRDIFFDYAFRDIVNALPLYTSLRIAAPGARRQLATKLARNAAPRPAQVHLISEPGVEVELWAQDLGEPVQRDGRDTFLVGMRLSARMGPMGGMSISRKRVAQHLFGEAQVVEADFSFDGGNLAFDSGRVLVGRNDVARTMRASELSRAEVEGCIGNAFATAEVIVMGDERPSPYLQHLDQAFVLLEDGIAVVNRLTNAGGSTESRQLRRHADALRELGYDLVFLDHEPEDVEKHWLSVNAVPFVDRRRQEKRILFPVFPGEVTAEATRAERRALRGKAARAYDTYRECGYQPIPVRDVAHAFGGSTHCIVNVLA